MPTSRTQGEVRGGDTRHLSRTLWLRGLIGNIAAPPEVDGLALKMNELFVPKGEHLYRSGGAADHICFIVTGCIKQGSEGLSEFRSGDILGFVDALRERPHKSDAIALVDTTVLLLAVEDWMEFLEDHFEFFRQVVFSRVVDLPLVTNGYETNRAGLLGLSDGELDSRVHRTKGASFVHALLALHSCPLFQKASIQAVAELARGAINLAIDGTEVDLRTQGRGLWVVVEGSVRLLAHSQGDQVERVSGPGELLGSLVPLGRRPEALTVSSQDGAWLLFLDQELFFDVMEDHFDLGRSAMSYLAAQVEAWNRRTERPLQRASVLPSPRGAADLGSSPTAAGDRYTG